MITTNGESMIPKSKGDYMYLVKKMDPRIKEMDSAIPLEVAIRLREMGLLTSDFVMMYWKNGEIELVNILAHWAVLTNSK